jgi:hypothetical protein
VIILGDFSTSLSPVGPSDKKKNKNKETSKLNYTIDEIDLTDIQDILTAA